MHDGCGDEPHRFQITTGAEHDPTITAEVMHPLALHRHGHEAGLAVQARSC